MPLTGPTFAINSASGWKSALSFGSFHQGGAMFGFSDGSVMFLPETINTTIYERLGNRKDGQPVTALEEREGENPFNGETLVRMSA